MSWLKCHCEDSADVKSCPKNHVPVFVDGEKVKPGDIFNDDCHGNSVVVAVEKIDGRWWISYVVPYKIVGKVIQYSRCQGMYEKPLAREHKGF